MNVHLSCTNPWYSIMDLGQQWFRWWLVAWQHQAISWTNHDLSSLRSSDIHLMALCFMGNAQDIAHKKMQQNYIHVPVFKNHWNFSRVQRVNCYDLHVPVGGIDCGSPSEAHAAAQHPGWSCQQGFREPESRHAKCRLLRPHLHNRAELTFTGLHLFKGKNISMDWCNYDSGLQDWFGHLDGLDEWVVEWVSGWVSGFLSEWVLEWVGSWVSGCLSEWVLEWVLEWVGAWVSGCLSEWVFEWVGGCLSEWVGAWVKSCVEPNHQRARSQFQ